MSGKSAYNHFIIELVSGVFVSGKSAYNHFMMKLQVVEYLCLVNQLTITLW